jgi:hypothetical protein
MLHVVLHRWPSSCAAASCGRGWLSCAQPRALMRAWVLSRLTSAAGRRGHRSRCPLAELVSGWPTACCPSPRRPPEEVRVASMASSRQVFAHVAKVCSMCFKCFIRMLEVFRLDVAKVDLDISVLQMLILLTLTFDSRCCKCSFCMLHILFSNVEDVFFECWGILLYVARNKTRNIT